MEKRSECGARGETGGPQRASIELVVAAQLRVGEGPGEDVIGFLMILMWM